jgi:hypothetical protein
MKEIPKDEFNFIDTLILPKFHFKERTKAQQEIYLKRSH